MRVVSSLTLVLGLALAACAGGITRDEQVLKQVQSGMTAEEVEAAVGVSYRKGAYANGTSSWTYKYNEANIHKLMHVIFGADGRVLRVDTEWDPDVYSKKR